MHKPIYALVAASLLLPLSGCPNPPMAPHEIKWLNDGEALYARSQYREAISRLDNFLANVKDRPEVARALYIRGSSYAKLEQTEPALADLRAAAMKNADPEVTWRSYVAIGTILFDRGDWLGAARALEAAVRRMPKQPPHELVLQRLGMCYERTGRWEAAQGPYREIAQRYPQMREAEFSRRRLALNATHFAIQCGAFADAANAEKRSQELKQRGLPVYIVQDTRDGRPIHVLLNGQFRTFEEAQRQLEIARRTAPDAVIWP